MKFLMFLFFAPATLSAAVLSGQVLDEKTGESLFGANVYLETHAVGTATDLDGNFAIPNVSDGSHTLVISFVGYKEYRNTITVKEGMGALVVVLTPEAMQFEEVVVSAPRAKLRETPIAFSDVPKSDIDRKLGSRSLPMLLNDTPGVYATEQGGGDGDSRINVRGFDQRNIAVMVNGVPVNNMETGWVYWVDWDVLSDVTSSIQVQRGLGASNLAIASVGGTLNIITDAARQQRGFKIKQEAATSAYYKTTVNFSSGLLNEKTALSMGFSRKIGNGIPDQTWTEGWAYFGALSFLASETHKFELFVVGTPQRHGHRLYKQPIGTFDADYARSLGAGATDAKNYGANYNPNWGYSPFSSYREFFNGKVRDARDNATIMEHENYYHKTQANLNWYWTPNDRFVLSNVFYWARGKGGGLGRLGVNPGTRADGSIDWQHAVDELNTEPASRANPNLVLAGEVEAFEIAAKTIMRNTGSLQYYYGYLGTGEYALTPAYKLAFGIDLRGYEGQHWREVRNLIGADYYVFTGDSNAATSVKRLGDKIAYHTDGLTRWGGGFVQIERQVNDFTAFLSTSASITGYKRIDYFRARVNGEWDQTDWKSFGGYTLKAGGNYNITPTVNVYANMGWLSTAPKFGSVYHYDNSLYDPTFNEKVASFELGAGYLKRGVITANANFYYTKWIDRSWPKSVYSAKLDQNFRFLLSGIDARHTGIEFDFKTRPHPRLEVRSMVSLGNWEWLNDARATFFPEEDPLIADTFQVYAHGLKVGDSAQKTLALSSTVFPMRGIYTTLSLRRFMDHYAKFDPANRTDPDDRQQSWKVPNYNLADLHAGYNLPGNTFGNGKVKLQLHIFNLFNARYISDADDGDNHDASTALVFLGLPRRWNISLSYDY